MAAESFRTLEDLVTLSIPHVHDKIFNRLDFETKCRLLAVSRTLRGFVQGLDEFRQEQREHGWMRARRPRKKVRLGTAFDLQDEHIVAAAGRSGDGHHDVFVITSNCVVRQYRNCSFLQMLDPGVPQILRGSLLRAWTDDRAAGSLFVLREDGRLLHFKMDPLRVRTAENVHPVIGRYCLRRSVDLSSLGEDPPSTLCRASNVLRDVAAASPDWRIVEFALDRRLAVFLLTPASDRPGGGEATEYDLVARAITDGFGGAGAGGVGSEIWRKKFHKQMRQRCLSLSGDRLLAHVGEGRFLVLDAVDGRAVRQGYFRQAWGPEDALCVAAAGRGSFAVCLCDWVGAVAVINSAAADLNLSLPWKYFVPVCMQGSILILKSSCPKFLMYCTTYSTHVGCSMRFFCPFNPFLYPLLFAGPGARGTYQFYALDTCPRECPRNDHGQNRLKEVMGAGEREREKESQPIYVHVGRASQKWLARESGLKKYAQYLHVRVLLYS